MGQIIRHIETCVSFQHKFLRWEHGGHGTGKPLLRTTSYFRGGCKQYWHKQEHDEGFQELSNLFESVLAKLRTWDWSKQHGGDFPAFPGVTDKTQTILWTGMYHPSAHYLLAWEKRKKSREQKMEQSFRDFTFLQPPEHFQSTVDFINHKLTQRAARGNNTMHKILNLDRGEIIFAKVRHHWSVVNVWVNP